MPSLTYVGNVYINLVRTKHAKKVFNIKALVRVVWHMYAAEQRDGWQGKEEAFW